LVRREALDFTAAKALFEASHQGGACAAEKLALKFLESAA
jgi:hypothetical protein